MIIDRAVFENEQELRSILYSDFEQGGQKLSDGFINFITEYPVVITDMTVIDGIMRNASIGYEKSD